MLASCLRVPLSALHQSDVHHRGAARTRCSLVHAARLLQLALCSARLTSSRV